MTLTAFRPTSRTAFGFLFVCLLLPWMALSQPIPHHEHVPKDPDAAAALFVKQFRQIVPYYSAQYHLTVTDVAQNKSNHSVRLTVRVDADQTIQPEKEYYIPFIAAPDMPWDITLLADNGYDLCMQVNSDRTINNYYGYGGLMVILTNADLIRAVGIDASKRPDGGNLSGGKSAAEMAQKGRDYLAKYASTISPHLPMPMGKGERFVQCYYVDSALTMTLEYDDSLWGDIRQFLSDNMDDVRVSRTRSLVEDTSNAIAISAYVSASSIRHIYRNHAHTDSLEVTVTPWMLDYVFSKTYAADGSLVESTPNDYLSALAQESDRQTPLQVDEETQLVQCSYDTAARLLTYVYEITDAAMLQYGENPMVQETLYMNILQYFQSDDPMVVELVKNIVAAEATVSYVYRSRHGKKPIVFTYSATEVKQASSKY